MDVAWKRGESNFPSTQRIPQLLQIFDYMQITLFSLKKKNKKDLNEFSPIFIIFLFVIQMDFIKRIYTYPRIEKKKTILIKWEFALHKGARRKEI